MRNNLGSYKMRGLIELLQLYRAKTNNAWANNAVFATSNGSFDVQSAGARFVHDAASGTSAKGEDGKPTSPKPPSPTPRPPPAARLPWIKMVLGSAFSLLLAFWGPKWTTLLKIGGETEVVLKDVEQAAEVVEKVANVVEKVSEELANKLPDDNKFKDTVLVVEHISQEAAKDAHIAEQIIHKVELVKEDLEDVGETIEPIIDEIVHKDKSNEAVNGKL